MDSNRKSINSPLLHLSRNYVMILLFIFKYLPNFNNYLLIRIFSSKICRGTDEFINCKIIAIPSKLDYRVVGWTFQKHSPYLPLFNHYLKMMMEKGIFKNLNNRFQPPPQICPDGAGKPIGFRNSITAFLVLSSMYYVICNSV